MRASLIISSYNEGDRLLSTIGTCVETCGGLDHELLLADDASTDGSVEEVQRLFPRVRVERHAERLGASPTKAMGARHARGEVLVFLDGHSKPEYGAVDRLVQRVEDVGGQSVITPAIAALDVQRWKNDFSQVGNGYTLNLRTFECGWQPLAEMRPATVRRVQLYESPALIGCALAVSRELYDKLWGFDAHMRSWGVEDLDFGLKCWLMGHRILHDPEAIVGHRFRVRFDNYPVPIEHVVMNQFRMARKNFTHGVWGEWLEGCRQRHSGRLADRPEGLWAHAWYLFGEQRASAEQERSYLHAQRVRDEFWYAERFGQMWPRLQAAVERVPPVLFEAAVSPSPSAPPPPCKVTGISPAAPTLFIGQPQKFSAQGNSLAGVQWSAPGGNPASGTGASFTTKWNTVGTKTLTATCGGTTATAMIIVLAVPIEINNTPAINDDIVQLKCDHPTRRFKVPCRIRVSGPASGPLTVVLTNPDGRLRFPDSGDTTTTLTLPANGAFTPFEISGESASAAIGDAKIEARLNTGAGAVVGRASVTVFTFDQARMVLTQGGNYGFVGTTYTVPGGVAVSFSSQASLRPAGLDCTAPQIANLRAAIMQESSAFLITTTWTTPTIVWDPAAPSGTTITVPTTMRESTAYDPSVKQPVNDGLTGAAPLYSKDPAALKPPGGCAGAGAATSSDTPGHPAPATFSQDFTSGGNHVATVTWTVRINTTRAEHFRTFCVMFDNGTQQFCSLREAIWTLNVDSSGPPADQHANVNADGAASADPAVPPPTANTAPQPTTSAGVGPATTTFTKP